MIDDIALTALQQTLSENREARRKIQTRLTQLEEEAAILRQHVNSFNAIIEQTETILRHVLFPSDVQAVPVVSAPPRVTEPVKPRPETPIYQPNTFRAANVDAETDAATEIEAEVAKLRHNEQSSNIRFTDFRIPQAATIVLRETDGPLHVSEIYRRMAEGGFEFRGQHQLITLAVSLSRNKRFRKVSPGTFDLDPAYRQAA